MKHFITLLSLFALLFSSNAYALNEVELVTNFETYPRPSYGGDRLVVGDKLFFKNYDSEHGHELWVLDSINGTPKLVKDIFPGPESSNLDEFIAFKGKLYFSALSSNDFDNELWYSDGTEAGTQRVGAIPAGVPAAVPRNPDNLTTFGQNDERLAFAAERDGIGTEFCITSGVASGTTCYNLRAGDDSSYPSDLIKLNDDLYFEANDGISGSEIWVMAYNAGAPVPFIDLRPGATGSRPYNFMRATFASTPALIFTAQTASGEYEPHITFGLGGLTYNVADLNGSNSSSPGNYYPVPGGGAIFRARTDAEGEEPWYTDGTAPGTVMLKDIYPGQESSYIEGFGTLGNYVYFEAQNPTEGHELWRTDGTVGGTSLVKDLEPGFFGAGAYNFFELGNKLFFAAETIMYGAEPYTTDGTGAGTINFANVRSGMSHSEPRDFFEMSGLLGYFGKSDDSPAIIFLNTTNGAIASTIPLARDSDYGAYPRHMAELTTGDVLVYLENEEIGHEPYALNPTTKALTLLKDISEGPDSSNVQLMGTVNGIVIFSAYSREYGQELWRTDGTPEGTFLLKDIAPQEGDDFEDFSSEPRTSGVEVPYNGYLYFSAETPALGRELWRTDGTPEGTMLFKDLRSGPDSSEPGDFLIALGHLFFQAKTSAATGVDEIFKTDGTTTGTEQLTNYDVSGVQYYSPMFEHDGLIFFGAEHPTLGRELYKSDGTPTGTVFAADISPAGDSFPFYFHSIGTKLLIGGKSQEHGPAYFSITPPYTTSEVELLVDPAPTNKIGGAGRFFEVFDKLFFTSITQDGGQNENTEPWITDGTPAGTEIFKIIQPGSGATEMSDWHRAGDYYYFSATEGDATGNELWRSDGTPEGTKLFADLRPGEDEADPELLGVFRGALYFTFYDDTIDKELWRIVFDECPDDSNKLEAGICGCGVVEDSTDSDGDGTPDCLDSCSTDALKTAAGACGCGVADEDLDASGVADCLIAEELRVRSDLLAQLLDEFKRKPKKGRKARIRAIFKAFKELNRYSRSQLDAFINSTKKKTKKRLKNLRRKVKKFRKKATNKNRRKAIKALARLLAIAP